MYEFLQFELNLREIARAPLTDDSLKETSQKPHHPALLRDPRGCEIRKGSRDHRFTRAVSTTFSTRSGSQSVYATVSV